MKKRGLPSPNMADACIMTFAQPISYYTDTEDDDEAEAYRGGYKPFDQEAGY